MAETIVHEVSTGINDPARDLLEIVQGLSPEDQQYILRLARRRQNTRQTLADNEDERLTFYYQETMESLQGTVMRLAKAAYVTTQEINRPECPTK